MNGESDNDIFARELTDDEINTLVISSNNFG